MTAFLDISKINEQKKVSFGDMTIYTKSGKVHRDGNLPAIITSWSQEWYVNGIAHRDDGPAKMYLKHPKPIGKDAVKANGERIVEFYINGEYVMQSIIDKDTFDKHWRKE